MEKIECKNCATRLTKDLEFCPKCGCYNELSEECNTSQPQDEFNKQPQSKEDILIGIGKDISTIKTILVFFTWLWGIGAVLWIILLLTGM
ncbi:MAG: hypothetical protein R3Y38_07870 [Rikenellaceae bacterium]